MCYLYDDFKRFQKALSPKQAFEFELSYCRSASQMTKLATSETLYNKKTGEELSIRKLSVSIFHELGWKLIIDRQSKQL